GAVAQGQSTASPPYSRVEWSRGGLPHVIDGASESSTGFPPARGPARNPRRPQRFSRRLENPAVVRARAALQVGRGARAQGLEEEGPRPRRRDDRRGGQETERK